MSNSTLQTIATDQAPQAIGPYSQAVCSGTLVFLSGQIPLSPAGELQNESFAVEAHQVMQNLAAVCKAAGGDLDQLVKLNVYVTDLANFATLNEIMASYLSQPYPARAAVQVAALPRGAQVEIEGIMQLCAE